jgi:hypothetical protein
MRLLYGGGRAGLLDGGTRSRVYWVGRGVYMGLYYANLSFVECRTMILGSICICIRWLYGYIDTD